MGKESKKVLRTVSFVGGVLGLGFLMLYMAGFFASDKIDPDEVRSRGEESLKSGQTVQASIETITEFYEAVGTVRPQTETSIEAQVTGRILEILVRPGDRVSKGKLLIVLDSRESQARLDQARQGMMSAMARREQAKQAVTAAEAVYAQAESEFERVKVYFDSEAATSQDLEKAESVYLQARAGVQRAQDGLRGAEAGVKQAKNIVEGAEVALDYTRITAPEDGEVAKRLAEPGDLAWPGKPLVVLQTREALRLEALIREGLIHHVQPGTSLQVVVGAINKTLTGEVEEVVPSADPMTRTFLVKVGLPEYKELFPGMFGRLLVPIEERRVIVVPETAIMRVGQLEMVAVKTEMGWQRIYVKTGKKLMGDKVEILSGLTGNELLALNGGLDA